MKKRTIIIHKHIFKNAGTTFDWILRNNFGNGFCDHRDDEAMRKGGKKYLVDYLNEHPNIKALSSHHIYFRVSNNSKFEFLPVYFVRHPIERIRSVYNFEKQQQSDSLGAKTAKRMSFVEYVAWRMRKDVPGTIRNFQTKVIAGLKPGITPKNGDLELALQTIRRSKFAGVVDLFDLSMEAFGKSFQDAGIDLNLNFTPQNVLQDIDSIDVEERANCILDELGGLAEEVLKNNKFDVQLYLETRKQLLAKLSRK